MPLALTWTSTVGDAPYLDCTGRVDTADSSYWIEVVSFDDAVDVSLWALPLGQTVRRSRDRKVSRTAHKDLRRSIIAAYRERVGEAH